MLAPASSGVDAVAEAGMLRLPFAVQVAAAGVGWLYLKVCVRCDQVASPLALPTLVMPGIGASHRPWALPHCSGLRLSERQLLNEELLRGRRELEVSKNDKGRPKLGSRHALAVNQGSQDGFRVCLADHTVALTLDRLACRVERLPVALMPIHHLVVARRPHRPEHGGLPQSCARRLHGGEEWRAGGAAADHPQLWVDRWGGGDLYGLSLRRRNFSLHAADGFVLFGEILKKVEEF